MRFVVWVIVGCALTVTVVWASLRVQPGSSGVDAQALATSFMLAGGGWLATRPATRRIGLVFTAAGLLGAVEPAMWLWERVGPRIPEFGFSGGLDTWLTHWLWVPQVLLVTLLVPALYPDGRARPRFVVWPVLATIAAGSALAATALRGTDHPLAVSLDAAFNLMWATAFLAVASLVSLIYRLIHRVWTGDRATRLVMAVPLTLLVLLAALVFQLFIPVVPAKAVDWWWIPAVAAAVLTIGLSRWTAVREDVRHDDSALDPR
ncbi:hypothetical protein HII36_40560 [Nonomuraea sp. NN258]|uniref:hypothetical protein n=1 Tax=Nonomuraea antri TaxID=2730852 RepID=UPI00156997F5|nr:hypothetical protein [Nonomuraea antri]NRQ38079.1 hypothetical protein [Nonomuraea antri]